MIRLHLKKDAMLTMYFDEINGGKSSFSPHGNAMEAAISQREFDGFLKDNNLVVYHNTLKGYEDGTVCGEFQIE